MLKPEDRQRILEFLRAHPIAVLATVDATGKPHAGPIYIGVDDKLIITFTTKRETQKYKNLSRDPSIMLVIYEAASQTAVQVSGTAKEVADPDAQQAIYHSTLQATRQTGSDEVPPIAKISAGSYVGFTIDIDNIWMSDYGWGSSFAKAVKHADDAPVSGDPL